MQRAERSVIGIPVRRKWSSRGALICGGLACLLLARLVITLFAVRLDNQVFSMLKIVTTPLTFALNWLDTGQPLHGARLEFSTLVMIIVVGLAGVGLRWRSQEEV